MVGKNLEDIKVVTSGAGAAGIAIIKLLVSLGLKNVVMCDRQGAIYKGRENLNAEKMEMAEICNQNMEKGTLEEVLKRCRRIYRCFRTGYSYRRNGEEHG